MFLITSLAHTATGNVNANPLTTATNAPSLTARNLVTIMAIVLMSISAVATLGTLAHSVMWIAGVQGMGYAIKEASQQRLLHVPAIWDGRGPRLTRSVFHLVLPLCPSTRA